jgi:hypothetical protein
MSASDTVWARVSGYPRHTRERRLLMVLQAVMDDSGGFHEIKNPVFVLAGFLADSSAWAVFSDEWQAALNGPPRLEYFKMSEAKALNGQFDGWDRNLVDLKLDDLVAIIKKHAFLRMSVSVDKESFNSIIRNSFYVNRTHNMNEPYYIAFQRIILMMPAAQALRPDIFGNTAQPIDFIFDGQDEIGSDAQQAWHEIKQSCQQAAQAGRTDFRPYLGKRPDFQNEKEFVALQAADFYAWQVRRLFFDGTGHINRWLKSLSTIPQVSKHIDRDDLEKLTFGIPQPSLDVYSDGLFLPFLGSNAQQKRNRILRRKIAKEQLKTRRDPSQET